jgi:hypothetical protein
MFQGLLAGSLELPLRHLYLPCLSVIIGIPNLCQLVVITNTTFSLFLKNTHSVVNNNGWAEGFLSFPDCITISSREGCGSLFMNRAGPKEEDEDGETS